MVPATALDGIPPYHRVSGGIDHREDVLVLKVDVYLPGHGIVLWDTGLTVEPQHLDDGVCPDVDDAFRFRALVGDVRLVEGRGVGDPVRLLFRWKSLDEAHARQIDDTNLVFSPVCCVDLPALIDRQIVEAFTRRAREFELGDLAQRRAGCRTAGDGSRFSARHAKPHSGDE